MDLFRLLSNIENMKILHFVSLSLKQAGHQWHLIVPGCRRPHHIIASGELMVQRLFPATWLNGKHLGGWKAPTSQSEAHSES